MSSPPVPYKRQFPDFLTALTEYTGDNFSPPQFNEWAALSILAGALERRVWIPWSDTYSFFPNIYVLLISRPGAGKSVALNKAVDILREVNRRTSTLNIMPSQVTEAKFIELMGHGRAFTDRSAGKEITVFQNAGYYFASEASNSLRNVFGEFIACLTDFYDCPPFWQRATKKDGKTITLKNVCMNLLAGSTFDYLGKLVSDENIQGGFASRLIYVVYDDAEIKVQQWRNGITGEDETMRRAYHAALVADLTHISQMTGPMTADAEFSAAWEAWYPEMQRHVRSFNSEKLQSVLARTNTNVLKVAMLLSASESDERILRLRHWDKAVGLMKTVNDQVPGIFREAKAAQGIRSGGSALADTVLLAMRKVPSPTREGIMNYIYRMQGGRKSEIGEMVDTLVAQGDIGTGAAVAGVGVTLKLLKDSY